MISQYKIIAVSHKSLNTKDLKHFIVKHNTEDELVRGLETIKDYFNQEEIFYLSTCNRVLFMFFGKEEQNRDKAIKLFTDLPTVFLQNPNKGFNEKISFFQGAEAMEHLFQVVSSLDSLVVGEREILKQFRDAYDFCRKKGLTGDNIRLVEKSVVRAAKDVFTNTKISTRPVSVVSLAIQKFLKRGLSKKENILLIGSGETNRTVGRYLKKYGYENLVIFNRTLKRAQILGDELNADARALKELVQFKEGFSAIFMATSSQDPILTKKIFFEIALNRSKKLLIDLAIPHNVSGEVSMLDTVDYISIDCLKELAEDNLQFRNGNIGAAQKILSSHLRKFELILEERRIERAFVKLPVEIKKVKERALTNVYKSKIESLSFDAQVLISEIADYMERKCVAVPMKLAKEDFTTGVNKITETY